MCFIVSFDSEPKIYLRGFKSSHSNMVASATALLFLRSWVLVDLHLTLDFLDFFYRITYFAYPKPSPFPETSPISLMSPPLLFLEYWQREHRNFRRSNTGNFRPPEHSGQNSVPISASRETRRWGAGNLPRILPDPGIFRP